MVKKDIYNVYQNNDRYGIMCIPIPNPVWRKLSALEHIVYPEINYRMILRLVDHFWNCPHYWEKEV